MKKSFILLISIWYLGHYAFALEPMYKMRICNYTLIDINFNISQVAGITVNDGKYTDFTAASIYNDKISAIHCKNLPLITAQGYNDVPGFFSLGITSDNGENALHYFYNLQARQSMLDRQKVIESFNIRSDRSNLAVFIHGRNDMEKQNIQYYNMNQFQVRRDGGYIQNLGQEYNYDFEFYVCEISQQNPCQNPEKYKYLNN